jgi:transcription factor STE12
MAASQKPETFMLSTEAQQALPHDAQVALQQVDNRECFHSGEPFAWTKLTRFCSQIFSHLCAR